MLNLTSVIAVTKSALLKYNKRLTNYLSDDVSLSVWSDGGEWPQYSPTYDNLFTRVRSMIPKPIHYMSCPTLRDAQAHIQYCRDSKMVCAMNTSYTLSIRMSIIQYLCNMTGDSKLVLVVRSAVLAAQIKQQFKEYDMNTFFKGVKVKSLVDNVDILSPGMVLDHYVSSQGLKYGTMVLYDADTLTTTYGLFGKILPYIADCPVYIRVLEQEMHTACTAVARDAVVCPDDTRPTLVIGYTGNDEGISPNILLDTPLQGYARVSDSQRRVVPVTTSDSRFTMLSRLATSQEKTRVAYWTLANGCHLVKSRDHSLGFNTGDELMFDRFDYYASLLWAIEVVTGVSQGNIVQAKRIWQCPIVYTPLILDPISVNLTGMLLPYTLSYLKRGCISDNITWKLYYYANVLHSIFVYEQNMTMKDNVIVVLRVGYVFKAHQMPVCRIMVYNSKSTVGLSKIVSTRPFVLNCYNMIRMGASYSGFDIRVGDSAHFRRVPCDNVNYAQVWSIACGILDAQRHIEFQSIVSLWHDMTFDIDDSCDYTTIVEQFLHKIC